MTQLLTRFRAYDKLLFVEKLLSPTAEELFILPNISCIRKTQVISGGGGAQPCTLPLDQPLKTVVKKLKTASVKRTSIVSESNGPPKPAVSG